MDEMEFEEAESNLNDLLFECQQYEGAPYELTEPQYSDANAEEATSRTLQ